MSRLKSALKKNIQPAHCFGKIRFGKIRYTKLSNLNYMKSSNPQPMRVRKNIATSDEGFIFNPTTGDSFLTNTIGAEIIRLMKNDLSSKELVEIIADKYDVDKTLFERDLEDFTIQLKEFSILE